MLPVVPASGCRMNRALILPWQIYRMDLCADVRTLRCVLILTLRWDAGTVAAVGSQRSSAVEQCFRKAKVAGSIPAAGSI